MPPTRGGPAAADTATLFPSLCRKLKHKSRQALSIQTRSSLHGDGESRTKRKSSTRQECFETSASEQTIGRFTFLTTLKAQ